MDKEDLKKIKNRVAGYNMIANIFWSAINLVPISVFCYDTFTIKWIYNFLALIPVVILLPRSFFDYIQFGKTTSLYNKMGVRFINKFTQNGGIINGLIRKKFPGYKVISNSSRSVNALLAQTYLFEKFHFWMFIFFTSTTIYALLQNYVWWALIITITNLMYNVYPNLLQQYIRVRLVSFRKKK